MSRLPGWFSRVDLIPFFLPAVLVLPLLRLARAAALLLMPTVSAGVAGLVWTLLWPVACRALVRFVVLGFLFAILLGPFHV